MAVISDATQAFWRHKKEHTIIQLPNSPGPDIPAGEIIFIKVADGYPTGGGSMSKFIVPDIHADVGNSAISGIEENKVTLFQVCLFDLFYSIVLVLRISRNS